MNFLYIGLGMVGLVGFVYLYGRSLPKETLGVRLQDMLNRIEKLERRIMDDK